MQLPPPRLRALAVALLAAVAAVLIVAAPAWAGPPPGNNPTRPDRLLTDEALHVDQKICSQNGLYCLIMQGDGNLVLYKPGNRPLWASNTRTAVETILQGDGNLVAYDAAGRAVWASNTAGFVRTTFVVQDDANLVVYWDTYAMAVWASNTAQRVAPPQPSGLTDRLGPGQALYRGGKSLTSANGAYLASVDWWNGQLMIWRAGYAMTWSTRLCPDDDWLDNNSHGWLYLARSDGVACWATGGPSRYNSSGPGASTLIMQNNGDLTLVRDKDGSLIWHSNTARP